MSLLKNGVKNEKENLEPICLVKEKFVSCFFMAYQPL